MVPASQAGQLSRISSACRHGPAVCAHNSTCTGTRQSEAAAQQRCGCGALPNVHVFVCVPCYDRPRRCCSTACCCSSNIVQSGMPAGAAPGPPHSRHLTSNGHQAVQQHHLQQQQHTVVQLLLDHQLHQWQQQQPAEAVPGRLQQVGAEQQRHLDRLVDATVISSSFGSQQQQQVLAAWLTQWCYCMQPYLQHLPLPALATVAVCLNLHKQQQQQQQQRRRQQQQQDGVVHQTEGRRVASTAAQHELVSSIGLIDAEFLHTYCLAAAAAAAAAADGATCSGSVDHESAYQRQWELVQELQQRQGRRRQHYQDSSNHRQQQLQAVSAIISWATQQLIQQQRHHWQQRHQQQQHAQQVQLHQEVRSHLLHILQVATSSRLLPAATPQILQELLVCYGRLGAAVDEAWMGTWLAAARHAIADSTVRFRAQQFSGSDVRWQQQQQQQLAAAVYLDLTGLLHGLSVAKVKPPESWMSVWQDAAVLVMQHTPDFSTDTAPGSAADAAAGGGVSPAAVVFLTSLHQLLQAVSGLKLKLTAEFWQAHEGLVQQQVLQFTPHQLLLLLQLHQRHHLKPSSVCVKYMTAHLAQHIHNAWQQQEGSIRGSSSVGGELLAVCMCVCGLAAWGVRLTMTATCELLVCLATHCQLLPLPWLIQVMFTLGPRLAFIRTRDTGRDSSSSSSSSNEQVCQAQQPPAATASAAAAVLELLEYATQHLAAQQQWQQSSSIAATSSSIRQLHQLLQLAAHLPRGVLHNTPLLSHLDALAAAAAPVCEIPDLVLIMTHWTHLGFSSAWRHGGMRRGYRRLGQPGVLQGLRNADLVAAAVAAAKLPVLQRVIWQLAGEVGARLARTKHTITHQLNNQDLGGTKRQQQQQQGFTPGQLVDIVSAVPALAAFWPPDQVLLLLQHIDGLEQQRLLNPADQWRVWSALQQLQQHWRPAVAAAAATATVHSGVAATEHSRGSSSSSVAAAPVHVKLQSSTVPAVHHQPAVGSAADDVSGGSDTGSSTLYQEYHWQQRQQQQELVFLLDRVQQQVAASLSNAAPVVLPVDAAPAAITPAVRKIQQLAANTSQIIPSAWCHEQQQHRGELTVEQLLQHLAKAHRSLQSPNSSPADITVVCEGLARLLAVPRFSKALSKVPAARDGVLRALEAAAWPDLDAQTLDGHQLLMLTRVCHALGVSEDRPYMHKISQACVETLTALPAKDLAVVLGRTAAVHVSGFCKCWEVVLLRMWVGRVQQLAVQNPEEVVGVLVPLVKLGFKPAPAAAALVLLPLLRTTAAAATAAVIESSSSNADQSSEQQYCKAQGGNTATSAASSSSDDLQPQQQQGLTVDGPLPTDSLVDSVIIPSSASAAAAGVAAGSSGAEPQSGGLSAKGLVLLTRLLVALNLRPDSSTADLLLSCQIHCMRSCNTTQLLQLAHCNLQLGLLGGPIRGLGVWSGQGALPSRVLIWVKTWLSWINRSFKVMSISQAVESVMLSTELDLLPVHRVHRTTHTAQAVQDICSLQQQLHAAAASAAASSSSTQLHDVPAALSAAVQASYQANRGDRQETAAAVERRARKHHSAAAAAAAAAADGNALDVDSDDEYSSGSTTIATSTTSSSAAIIRVGAASSSSSSSSVMARRSAIASASTAASNAGFSYPPNPKTLLLYQLQQQRCALLWAAVKFRLVTIDLPWVTKCLSVFQNRLDSLPPAVVLGLLNAATEASNSSSRMEGDAGHAPSPMLQLVFSNLCSRLSAQLLEQVLSSWLPTDLLEPAVASLAAHAAATQVRRQQQQHWWSAGEQPAGFELTHQQRRRLQIVILRQLPYLQAGHLSGLIKAMASLPVRTNASAMQPETVRPSPHFLARACQVLATRASSAAGQPTQQLLLLAAAQQLMALQPADVIGIADAAVDVSVAMPPVQGTASAAVNASSSLKPATAAAQQSTQAGSATALSPVVPPSTTQIPRSAPAGVGQLVTRTLGAAGLQVLVSLVQRFRGNTQQRQQVHQQQQSYAVTPVGMTLSGLAAQMMAWSKAVQQQQQQQQRRRTPAAAVATGVGSVSVATQQQQQLVNVAVVLGMAGDSSSSSASAFEQQQQQPGLSGPGQQQLLGLLLRLELQQALRPQLAAAAHVWPHGAEAAGADSSNERASTAVEVARAPRHVAARGLLLKFDGLVRWAIRAAAAAATIAVTDADSSSSSSSNSSAEVASMRAEGAIAAAGADASSSRRRSNSNSSTNSSSSGVDSSVVVLPVMSRALDVQFARMLRQVLQYNMASHGKTE